MAYFGGVCAPTPMTLRFALLFAALLSLSAAQAQPGYATSFADLTPGNRWEYVETSRLVTPAEVTGRRVTTIEAEIVAGAVRYSVATSQRFAPDGSPTTDRTTCAYDPATGIVYSPAPAGPDVLPNYSCTSAAFAFPPFSLSYTSTSTGASTVLISGQTVAVDSLFTRGNSWTGTSGQGGNFSETFARSFGMVYGRSYSRTRDGTGVYTTTSTGIDLTYARVRGIEYGQSTVGGEAAPVSAVALRLSATPNPSVGPVQIRAVGAVGALTVDVFDALGRRVDGGAVQGDAAFTFRASAAGVYVVRATDEARRVVTKRVVRR